MTDKGKDEALPLQTTAGKMCLGSPSLSREKAITVMSATAKVTSGIYSITAHTDVWDKEREEKDESVGCGRLQGRVDQTYRFIPLCGMNF